MTRLAQIFATWFGSGYLRPAPGTWGTLAALPFGMFFLAQGTDVLLVAVLVLTARSFWSIHIYEKETGEHDASRIVIDEALGLWIALLFCNFDWVHIGVAFLGFRFFDILKPWPISYCDQKIPGALGTILDDVFAGLAAGFIIFAGIHYNVW